MLVYIIHKDKINIFRIPEEASGKYQIFDYDSFNNKRNLVNVEAKDNKWYIYDNENVKISYNNQQYPNIELVLYNFYQLTILGKESVLFYVLPSYDSTFFAKEIVENAEFTIGLGAGNDIVYGGGIAEKQLKISYINGIFSFQNLDTRVPIYLNKIKKDKGIIHNFDTIFLMGLKIVFCNNKLFINNPNSKVNIVGSNIFKQYEDRFITENHETDVRSFTDFYEEADYYSKAPLFKSQIKPIDLTITEPPSKEERDKSSVLISVIPTLLMTLTSFIGVFSSVKSFRAGEATSEDLLTALVMCIAMVVAGILWPFVEKIYGNIITVTNNMRRNRKYKKYLKQKEEVLKKELNAQKMAYVANNIDLEIIKKVINKRYAALFHRDYDSEDFLNIRLGIGDVKLEGEINYTKPDYAVDKDTLLNDIDKLIEDYQYIKDVPYTISLKEKNNIAFILSDKELYETYMGGIILQLLTFHSYYDLKLIVLTSENSPHLSYLKDMNHCWSDDRSIRYFATTVEEAQNISTQLEREFKIRESVDRDTNFKKFYLIISDCINQYRNLNIVIDILNKRENLGFGLLMYDTKISNIPSDCINFVNISTEEGSIFQTNMNDIMKFKPEFTTNYNLDVEYYARTISNIPVYNNNASNAENSELPSTYGFLQMYGVGNVDQLNASKRWENSNPSNSLAVPVGIDVNGNYITLDLHEKNHGPHGLVAGMTGAGKSEFIITYILSMAVNFHPDEVQFVLIDYKGGGLAGAFENRKERVKLPHLVGTITNLDTAEMKRTLVSIKSEIQRRQKIFNEAKEILDTGNIDIYKYQKLHREGVLQNPLAHLFIICDEFAELKDQQPDFMDELVSAARIGRSLGIHLILATQKPSGVVDEQIWSNSKFKVCCKVQTTDDSNEMIRRPDAAYLKESGRFYLQVGYDEYFILGQSAYSGMPYIPSETIVSKIDNTINIIGNTGEVIKNITKSEEVVQKREDLGEELINIIKYLIDVADNNKYTYKQLWLDNIPYLISYDYVIKKYGIKSELYNIDLIVGEYDDPKRQKQGYASLPVVNTGNIYIAGNSGSGKNTLFSTMIYSTIINHNCDEVNIYILDLGAEKLVKFQKAPQVGDVLTIDQKDKIKYLFYMLEDIKNTRQKYYADNGGDFASDVANKKCPFPNILVFIYDIEVFKETFEDLFDDMFVPFTRNCAKSGIFFITCSTSVSSLGFLAENNFPKKIGLNLVDSSDYSIFFNTNLIPSKNPGRGLIQINEEVYEFQAPVISENDPSDQKLNYVFEQLTKFLKNKAPQVPVILDVVDENYLNRFTYTLEKVPIGINLLTAQTSFYDFSKRYNLILSSKNNYGESYVSSLIKIISRLQNKTIIVMNGIKDLELELPENIKYYDSGFKKIVSVINSNILKYNEIAESENEFIIVIMGYSKISKSLEKAEEDENVITAEEMLGNAKNNKFFNFILYDTASAFNEISSDEIANYVDSTNGIWIGRSFENQSFFETFDSYNDNVNLNSDSAVLINDGKVEYAKFIKM